MNKLQGILEELEKEAQAKKVIISNAYNNQPEIISVSSDSATTTFQNTTNDSFYSFTVNLIRPAIGVKSIQLLKANIPQATALSFYNGELVFPYYRIKTQDNISHNTTFSEQPNINNLYYVRLLPSYYPPNIIPNSQLYGFNKTFNNYQELSDELAKACANDLLYTNLNYSHFIPNDCLISYNSDYNKFQFKGNNTTTVWTPDSYVLNPATTYQQNNIVRYNSTNYISLKNSNTVNAALIIYTWTSGQQFHKYNIANVSGTYYTALLDSLGETPVSGIYWWPSLYDPTYDYGGVRIGFNCYYNGYWYVAISSASNIGKTPSTSGSYWRLQPYSSGTTNGFYYTAYPWTTGIYYFPNNIILYTGLYYKALTYSQDVPPTGDPLSSTSWALIAYADIYNTFSPVHWYSGTYSIPFNIAYSPLSGLNYVCVAENTGIDPTDTSYGQSYWINENWSSSINYQTKSPQGGVANFPVKYNDVWYSSTSLTGNINKRPDLYPEYWNTGATITAPMNWWTPYTDGFSYTYLIAGFNDPNVLTLQNNINSQLLNENADFFYGRYGLNNIISIPPQPVKKGKTLALRLGFSWDGVYTWPGTNAIDPLLYIQGSSLPIFWNRFRPIPPYELLVDLGSIPIPNNNPYTSTTYIAENFCNLVYTSILSIITNVTTASSLDSTSRRNLLSLISMNCGQLGITFADTFIDTPLTKINNDIYQINIELRDELGEPFYISNNGIATILLKLTY